MKILQALLLFFFSVGLTCSQEQQSTQSENYEKQEYTQAEAVDNIKYPQLPRSKDQRISFVKYIDNLEGMSAEVLYKGAREWVLRSSKAYNTNEENNSMANVLLELDKDTFKLDSYYFANAGLRHEDTEKKRLVAHPVIKYYGGNWKCIRLVYMTYDLRLSFKDGKVRLEATNFTYDHYNQISLKKMQFYGWSDSGVCGSANPLEELVKCDHCTGQFSDFYDYIAQRIEAQKDSLHKHLKSNKLETEEW